MITVDGSIYLGIILGSNLYFFSRTPISTSKTRSRGGWGMYPPVDGSIYLGIILGSNLYFFSRTPISTSKTRSRGGGGCIPLLRGERGYLFWMNT